jgi:hypothetical protein
MVFGLQAGENLAVASDGVDEGLADTSVYWCAEIRQPGRPSLIALFPSDQRRIRKITYRSYEPI